jgi:hypothetical protein
MQRYRALALFVCCIFGAASAETPAPRVQGVFVGIDDVCKKRCNDDAACIQKCPFHRLTHDELQEILKEQQNGKAAKISN